MAFIEVVHAWLEQANQIQSPLFSNQMEFGDFVLLVISIFVLVSWILSIFFVLYWGLLLILSWWKEDKIKPAINTIRYAVLWLIITVLAIFLFPIFGRLLGIDVEKYAKPSRIFEKIEQIWNNIFWTSSSDTFDNSSNIENTELPSNFSDL